MKIEILANGDVQDKTCYAHFQGKDGLGTCNTACAWWLKSYVEGDGCVMWTPMPRPNAYRMPEGRSVESHRELPEAKGVFCYLDNEPCLPDEEGFGRCGDLLKTCLWAEKEKRE